LTGVQFECYSRPAWENQPGDRWQAVSSIEEACTIIPSQARVLLALGKQHIAPFAKREDVFFLVRIVDQPEAPLSLPNHELLIGKPSSDPDAEAKVLKENSITHIVCRNSGGTGAYAKIKAAREMNLPVIMIQREK
ncbi:MAG: precorrin-6A/cobalt-precorrin-6A reductase, partial [Pseudomonadota bacterium]